MKIPNEVENLLANLEADEEQVRIQDDDTSKAVVHIGRQTFELDAEQCQKIFQDTGTTELFFEALGEPDECSVELHSVEVEADVHEQLEELFDSVDVY